MFLLIFELAMFFEGGGYVFGDTIAASLGSAVLCCRYYEKIFPWTPSIVPR